MSMLWRPFLYDRYFFVTVKLLPSRSALEERDYARLALALARMRQKRRYALTAWVSMPDHWHAILYPSHPLSIAKTMSAIKVSSMVAINHGRHEKGKVWQERFFGHALRTVKEYGETVEYIHLNPVKRGLVKRTGEWKWSSFPEYAGADAAQQQNRCGLTIDRVGLPTDETAEN